MSDNSRSISSLIARIDQQEEAIHRLEIQVQDLARLISTTTPSRTRNKQRRVQASPEQANNSFERTVQLNPIPTKYVHEFLEDNFPFTKHTTPRGIQLRPLYEEFIQTTDCPLHVTFNLFNKLIYPVYHRVRRRLDKDPQSLKEFFLILPS